MTDREKVLWLAEKVMGWKLCACRLGGKSCGQIYDGNGACRTSWNPLESWADAMEVQAKILADSKTADNYLYRLKDLFCAGRVIVSTTAMMRRFISATPAERMDAMILAMQEGIR